MKEKRVQNGRRDRQIHKQNLRNGCEKLVATLLGWQRIGGACDLRVMLRKRGGQINAGISDIDLNIAVGSATHSAGGVLSDAIISSRNKATSLKGCTMVVHHFAGRVIIDGQHQDVAVLYQ